MSGAMSLRKTATSQAKIAQALGAGHATFSSIARTAMVFQADCSGLAY
jgi:transcriptional regulator